MIALFFLPCLALCVLFALLLGDGIVSSTAWFAFYLAFSIAAFSRVISKPSPDEEA